MKEAARIKIIQLVEEIETNLFMIRKRSDWAETSLKEICKILEQQGDGNYGVIVKRQETKR